MNLKIVNETYYKKIRIICEDKIVLLKRNETATLNINSQSARIQIDILDKNRTFFFFSALCELWFWEILTTDSAFFFLNCSTSFDIVFNESSETLVLKHLDYREKKTHCDYESVYVKNENSTISDVKFFAKNSKKIRNKTIKNLLVFISGLPFIVLFLYWFIKDDELAWLILSFLIFVFLTIPSILKSIKVWKYCKNEYINQFLSEKEAILRQNNGEEPPRVPANFVEKAMFKFLDKIFNKKEE